MPMAEGGVKATLLYTEVWYQVEMSPKGQGDWCLLENRSYDSMIKAKSAMDRCIAEADDVAEVDYRLVRVTTATEEVKYLK